MISARGDGDKVQEIALYIEDLKADHKANVEAHRWLLENAKKIFEQTPVRNWDEVILNSEHVLSSLSKPDTSPTV